MLEECKVDYEIKTFKRRSKRADPELKKIHPLGKAPVMSVQVPGREQPIILAESGSIIEYLAEHFAPHLIPERYAEGKEGVGEETESWLRYRYFMHYAEGSLMPLLASNLIFSSMLWEFIFICGCWTLTMIAALKGPLIPFFIRPISTAIYNKVDALYFQGEYASHFSFLESQIASSPDAGEFLCGKDLTAADILMCFPISAAKASGHIDKEKYPKLLAYSEKLDALPASKQAVSKIEKLTGEDYAIL